MTLKFSPDDPRIDEVVDLLLGFPDGLPKSEVVKRLDVSPWVAREVLRVGRLAGRLARVHHGNGGVLWAAEVYGPKLRALYQSQSHAATIARHRRKREADKARKAGKPVPSTKLYDNPDFDPQSVHDLPVVHRVVSSWKPVRQAPGPVSIFHLGASHA